jgi:hypothetical protein
VWDSKLLTLAFFTSLCWRLVTGKPITLTPVGGLTFGFLVQAAESSAKFGFPLFVSAQLFALGNSIILRDIAIQPDWRSREFGNIFACGLMGVVMHGAGVNPVFNIISISFLLYATQQYKEIAAQEDHHQYEEAQKENQWKQYRYYFWLLLPAWTVLLWLLFDSITSLVDGKKHSPPPVPLQGALDVLPEESDELQNYAEMSFENRRSLLTFENMPNAILQIHVKGKDPVLSTVTSRFAGTLNVHMHTRLQEGYVYSPITYDVRFGRFRTIRVKDTRGEWLFDASYNENELALTLKKLVTSPASRPSVPM